jgi:hypothetical protein
MAPCCAWRWWTRAASLAPRGADYAELELEEALLSALGGLEGLALVRANPRIHTTLYLTAGGCIGLGKVLKGHKFTKYLPIGELKFIAGK